MAITAQAIVDSMLKSIATADHSPTPYERWYLTNCLSEEAAQAAMNLPFAAPSLDGVSGKRELHNATRTYFDKDNMARYEVCNAVNEAFQSDELSKAIAKSFGTNLDGTYLRIEYAQDTNGFWLEPHTDLGVKAFTMLLYMSPDESHKDLGTDYYDTDKKHIGRSPFEANAAFVFVPSGITYHGFESRRIEGVRKSIIINYVTNEWRAREQLAFPETPISH